MTEKPQSSAQRVTNPVWLRDQIGKILGACDASLAKDQALLDRACGDDRAKYLVRITTNQHWKQQLSRVLRGTAFEEDLHEIVRRAACP